MSDVIIVAMTNDNTLGIEASSPPSPRVIGWIWVGYFLIGVLGTLLTKGIVVPTDAASTANNILAHASLYRAGFAIDLLSNLIYVVLTALVFQLFRPVNPTLALLAAFFSLVGCTVQIMGELLRVAPTVVLATPQLASAFGAPQLQAAALLSVTLYKSVFYIVLRAFCLLRARYRFSHSPVDVSAEVAWLVVDRWWHRRADLLVATTGDVDMAPAYRGWRRGIRLAGVAAGERRGQFEVASSHYFGD